MLGSPASHAAHLLGRVVPLAIGQRGGNPPDAELLLRVQTAGVELLEKRDDHSARLAQLPIGRFPLGEPRVTELLNPFRPAAFIRPVRV